MIGVEGLALLHIVPRLEVLAEPVILGRRVDDLADALAGQSSRDGADHGDHGGTDGAGDGTDRQPAGGPADGGADARLDRVRARLVGDGIGLRLPLGGRSAVFSGSFLLAMLDTPETDLHSSLRSAGPRPAARVASVPGTSASRLPTAPEYAEEPRIPPLRTPLFERSAVLTPWRPLPIAASTRRPHESPEDRPAPAGAVNRRPVRQPLAGIGEPCCRATAPAARGPGPSPDSGRRPGAARRSVGAGGAGVEPARLVARPHSRRVPSPVG